MGDAGVACVYGGNYKAFSIPGFRVGVNQFRSNAGVYSHGWGSTVWIVPFVRWVHNASSFLFTGVVCWWLLDL